ncbi:putative membrane protein [Nocardia mexicana]|uniref:Putative membrane protein n=2 Tax=Nocardia mexicana TaxID=279262 RepID=A0A370H381_9NOCA|nr:putative membrane protein [Nocardia mexicana]
MPGAAGYPQFEGPGAAQYGSEPVEAPPAMSSPSASGGAPIPPPAPGRHAAAPGNQPASAEQASGAPAGAAPGAPPGTAPGQGGPTYGPPTQPMPGYGDPSYGPPGQPPPGWTPPPGAMTSEYGQAPPEYDQAPPGYGQQQGAAAPVPPPAGLNVGDALGYGWHKFRDNPIPWIAVTLVGFVAYLAVTLVINVGDVNSLLPLLLIFLVVALVVWLLQAAMIRGGLYECDGTPPDFQAFFGFVNAGNVLLTALLVFVAASVGIALFVIPGIIVGFLCMFSLHFVIDRDLDPFSAIKASAELVIANLGPVLLLALAVVVMTFFSMLLCGIPLLVTGPLTAIAVTYSYRILVDGLIA